ncbi:MAG: hypothetical protein Q4C48_03410 [Lachnospiraceae bacterium]|nr:hypothetical protein [Lachnospiraceae bacterium]
MSMESESAEQVVSMGLKDVEVGTELAGKAVMGNGSYVVTDQKGELLRIAGLLEKQGYQIRVLDLQCMAKSHGYNPYFSKEEKV